MEQKTSLKIILLVLLAVSAVALTMLAVVPALNRVFAVEVVKQETFEPTNAPVPDKPEALLVTALYGMEDNSKKIEAIYIEVFLTGNETVTWFEVPVDTKVNLSEDLYKSLQTYAPELPQYLKLSNMAEGFSKEYGLTGCNRILSEILGVTVNEYLRADKKSLMQWSNVLSEEKSATGFFADYTEWIASSDASLSLEERWMYYESLSRVSELAVELAPGSREKDGYLISGKRSKERLQELMLRGDSKQ